MRRDEDKEEDWKAMLFNALNPSNPTSVEPHRVPIKTSKGFKKYENNFCSRHCEFPLSEALKKLSK